VSACEVASRGEIGASGGVARAGALEARDGTARRELGDQLVDQGDVLVVSALVD
jgi:hypothetical protein